MGDIGGTQINVEHRRLILYNDWLPMVLGLGFLSFGVGALIFLLPRLLESPHWSFHVMAAVVGAAFVINTISTWVGGVVEFYKMKQAIDNNVTTVVASTSVTAAPN